MVLLIKCKKLCLRCLSGFCVRQSSKLREIPQFHLISWFGNFVEKHSFHIRKLAEITVLYAVVNSLLFLSYYLHDDIIAQAKCDFNRVAFGA